KFDSLGNPLTDEKNITDEFSNDLFNPAAVRLPIAGQADGLAVAFELDDGSHLDDHIFVVRTDAGLSLLEGITIEFDATVFASHPSITSFSNGSLWVSYTAGFPDHADIVAKRVDPAGLVTNTITLFAADTDVFANHSDLATLANGNFVAVFSSF